MDNTIQTKRLLLRKPKLSDASWVTEGLSNFEVAGNMLVPHPFQMDMALDWLNHAQALKTPKEIRFSIEYQDRGVGVVSFREKMEMPNWDIG